MLINITVPLKFLLALVMGVIIISACSKDYATQNTPTDNVTLKQAEQIVFVQVLNSNDSGKIVYELPAKMNAGDSVKAKGGDSTYTAQNDSWFFFIDDKPGFRWEHPCRYLFLGCSDGKYIIINERNEPENIDSLEIVNFE